MSAVELTGTEPKSSAVGVTEIIEGMIVKLDTGDGTVVPATGESGEIALGIAADTKSTDTSGLPTTNVSGTAAYNAQANFVNRVSDSFDETRASGRMTVYVSGGVFATNQYTGAGFNPGTPVYVSSGALLTTTPSASAQIVGYVIHGPAAEDSGVPGLDVADKGSMTLGNYVEFKSVL